MAGQRAAVGDVDGERERAALGVLAREPVLDERIGEAEAEHAGATSASGRERRVLPASSQVPCHGVV